MKLLLADIIPTLFDNVDRNNQGDINQLIKIAGNAVRIVMFFAGVAAVVMIIVAGIMYISSSGDPNNTAKAKNTIINTIIGLILVIFAYAIVSFVVGKI